MFSTLDGNDTLFSSDFQLSSSKHTYDHQHQKNIKIGGKSERLPTFIIINILTCVGVSRYIK